MQKHCGASLMISKLNFLKILLGIAFLLGLALIIIGFRSSTPLIVEQTTDVIFNHINYIYWVGLALTLVSIMAYILLSNNRIHKLTGTVMVIILFYLIFLMFPMLPGSDSQFFTGLSNQYQSADFNPQANYYYQWPALFAFSSVLSSLLEPSDIHFISVVMFVALLMIMTIYLYLLIEQYNPGFAAVGTIIFFYSLQYFLNVQYAAQYLALALFFPLVYFSLQPKSQINTVLILVLSLLIVISHAFFFLFFIIFVVVRIFVHLLNRKLKILQSSKKPVIPSFLLVIIFIFIFISYTFFYAPYSSSSLIDKIDNKFSSGKFDLNKFVFMKYINLAKEQKAQNYAYLNETNKTKLTYPEQLIAGDTDEISEEMFEQVQRSHRVMAPKYRSEKTVFLDELAQKISRGILLSLAIILISGTAVLLFKKKLQIVFVSLGIAGLVYMLLGTILPILGERGLQLAPLLIIPGLSYYMIKWPKITMSYLLVLIFVFPLISIHQNFDTIFYQTSSEKAAADYVIAKIEAQDWNGPQHRLYLLGAHTSSYYVVGSIDASRYDWTKLLSDRYVRYRGNLRQPDFDFIMVGVPFEKAFIRQLKVNQDYIESTYEYYDSKYNMPYSNSKSSVYELVNPDLKI